MLDQYLDAPRKPETLAARREALIDQLGWLSDEAKALEPMLAELPAWALDQSPMPNERTAKETLAELAARDREVYPAWIAQLIAEDAPELISIELPADETANVREIGDLLGEVREARASLTKSVAEIPESEWKRTATLEGEEVDLFAIALIIVRHDADRLRDLAYRLHEADLKG